jgi:hypothetical protein
VVTEADRHLRGFWEILGLRKSDGFFASLPDLLEEGAVLCLEETSMDRGLRLFLEENAVTPGRTMDRGTVSPPPRQHHIPVRPELMAEVQDFADRIAEPEVCDHLHAYRGEDLLIEWFDAWNDPLLLSRAVPGKKVAVLCRRVGVTHVPRPFTPAEIRDAMPVGFARRYRVTGPEGVEGYREWKVLEADEKGARIEHRELTPDLSPMGEPSIGRSEWTELQSHATFPANATTIEDVEHETPAGMFPCLLYTVFGEDSGVGVLHRFWFARTLPGAPVEFESLRDGELMFRHTLVETSAPGAPLGDDS